MTLTNTRLDELAAMEQAATAGEWRIDATLALGAYGVWRYDDATDKVDFICSVIDYAKDQSFEAVAVRNHNAAFIAAARNEFAGMIEQCREANRLREAMKATFEATTFGRVFAIIAEALKGADS